MKTGGEWGSLNFRANVAKVLMSARNCETDCAGRRPPETTPKWKTQTYYHCSLPPLHTLNTSEAAVSCLTCCPGHILYILRQKFYLNSWPYNPTTKIFLLQFQSLYSFFLTLPLLDLSTLDKAQQFFRRSEAGARCVASLDPSWVKCCLSYARSFPTREFWETSSIPTPTGRVQEVTRKSI